MKVCTNTGNSADIERLVVHKRPLDFDLLLGYGAIKALGGVLITQSGTVKFCGEAPVCAALKIDRPDISVEFERWCGPPHGNGRERVNHPSYKTAEPNTTCPVKQDRRVKRSSMHGLTLAESLPP